MTEPGIVVVPAMAYLPSYRDALERGWSPDTIRTTEAADEQLRAIERNPAEFVAKLNDETTRDDPVELPDGSTVPRLPGFRRWVWDGDICGSIGFRWQRGTSELPPYVLGHIGFSIVPWKRGRGHAKAALTALLPEARRRGLEYVDLTTDLDNVASQRVILSAGGRLIEQFQKHLAYGDSEALRYRIDL